MDAIADAPPPQCVGLGPYELMETIAQPAREIMESAQVGWRSTNPRLASKLMS